MIGDAKGVYGAFLGTLFTWSVTALGASIVWLIPRSWSNRHQRLLLDSSFGFAAGVMIAASFWSLLAPAIELAESSGRYGSFSILPIILGFVIGAAFVHGADSCLSQYTDATTWGLQLKPIASHSGSNDDNDDQKKKDDDDGEDDDDEHDEHDDDDDDDKMIKAQLQAQTSWRRIALLVIAITMHNFPEGLAVGVGFGGALPLAKAKSLAIGIGLQNLPEGLAVSLPLYRSGMSRWKAFFFGQLSGMVEPIAGVLGAIAVTHAQPLLPYAMAFAAGAMIFVVVDDVLPESQEDGNVRLTSWACITGFTLMMTMDCTLG